ncbi:MULTISPECIES: hypothetical protein [unclassified Halomonas]|uniref:hypothetical protein n=1 Tax=unclassified Halomonas TaxID=2609666 RepID=UPI00207684B4|nr:MULTISPECIES: hypothetical protein [unclassified Halomonas]
MGNFGYRGKQVEFWQVQGEVLDTDRYSETHVQSQGINNRYLRVSQRKYHDFWVRDDEGREHSIQLEEVNVPLRPKQRITLVCAKRQDKKEGLICSLVNHSTGQEHEISSGRTIENRLNLEHVTGKTLVLALVAFALVVYFTKPSSEYFAYPWRMVEWKWAFVASVSILILGVWRKSLRKARVAKKIKMHVDNIVTSILKC